MSDIIGPQGRDQYDAYKPEGYWSFCSCRFLIAFPVEFIVLQVIVLKVHSLTFTCPIFLLLYLFLLLLFNGQNSCISVSLHLIRMK